MKRIVLTLFLILVITSTLGVISATDIYIWATDYSADVTIHNLGTHELSLGFDRQLKCDVSTQACINTSCNPITPISMTPSNTNFFTGFYAKFSLAQGYTYSTTLNCQDKNGSSISKTFSFNVANDAVDTSSNSSGSGSGSSGSSGGAGGGGSSSGGSSSGGGGGGSGRRGTVKRCNNDSDCGVETSVKYCSGNNLCTKQIIPNCLNAGTSNSYCDNASAGSSRGCSYCNNGCQNGNCIESNNNSENSSGGGVAGGSSSSGNNNQTETNCGGCKLDNKCVDIGYRNQGKYCDINGEFIIQNKASSECQNNFECDSNLCINNQCVSGSVWQKILNWFSKLFGSK